jgi:hypothetical protein
LQAALIRSGGDDGTRTRDLCRESAAGIGFTITYNNAGTAKIPVSRTRHRILWVGMWVENIFPRCPPYAVSLLHISWDAGLRLALQQSGNYTSGPNFLVVGDSGAARRTRTRETAPAMLLPPEVVQVSAGKDGALCVHHRFNETCLAQRAQVLPVHVALTCARSDCI